MATERIAQMVRLYKVDTNNRARSFQCYHNAKPGVRIRHAGHNYYFLPFIYSGATVSRTGDNVISEVTLSSNDIARSNVANIVNQHYRMEVFVLRMNQTFTDFTAILSEDTWLVASAVYDATAIQISLSSGLDAVNANTPRRVLTSADVGPLPVTGNVRL